jgi:hypothetical protein
LNYRTEEREEGRKTNKKNAGREKERRRNLRIYITE